MAETFNPADINNPYALQALGILDDKQDHLAPQFLSQEQIDALELLGKENAPLAIKFIKKEQVAALRVVIKNGHPPQDALKFIAPTSKWGTATYEYKALLAGVTVDESLIFKNSHALDALNILGIKQANLASQFSQESQIEALRQVIKNGHPPQDALKFISSTSNWGFWESYEFQALKAHANVDLALKIKNKYALQALDILPKDKTELAPQFSSSEQINALKLLGKEKIELAPQFLSNEQVEALNLVGKENAKLAIKFTSKEHIKVLKVLQKHSQPPEDTLKFVEQQKAASNSEKSYQLKALEAGATVDKALTIKNQYALKAFTEHYDDEKSNSPAEIANNNKETKPSTTEPLQQTGADDHIKPATLNEPIHNQDHVDL